MENRNPWESMEKYQVHLRARGRLGFRLNAFFWGAGNGLIGTSLVIYLVWALADHILNKGEIELLIAWIIAAPRLLGVFRLATPTLIDIVGSRRLVCFVGYLLSVLILLFLPIGLPCCYSWCKTHPITTLWMIGGIWGFYHLFEYIATVALWSWLGDLISPRIGTRFIAQRERALLFGQLPALLAAGLYTWYCLRSGNYDQTWRIYLVPARLGIVFLFLATFSLLLIPEIPWKKVSRWRDRVRDLLVPLASPYFVGILLLGIWIQIANGITQGAQVLFEIKVLGISMLTALLLRGLTRSGQILFTGTSARLFDRYDHRLVLAIALLLVSCGSLCYCLATPQDWYWILAAAVIWIGWVTINIGMQSLLLDSAPSGKRSSWFALYFMSTTLAFGLSTLVGGWLLAQFGPSISLLLLDGDLEISGYKLFFLIGWFFRVIGLLFLLLVRPRRIKSSSRIGSD